ncbi:MAG: GDSL-type esterase/lipase family protein [Myxococcota bacterium]
MKKILSAIGLIGLFNALVLCIATLVRSSVVDSWRKGPLIDPIAPYAPENAQWLFSIGLCSIINLYLVFLFLVRHQTKRIWLPVICFVMSLSTTEIGMQVYLGQVQQSYFRPHAALSWIVRPNLNDFPNQTGGGTLNTNADSMRAAREWTTKSNRFRILVLGDSSNFGHGVSDGEMWSTQLELILKEQGLAEVEVYNGSCPGWTTHQGIEALKHRYSKYKPDLVLVGFNNDSGPDFMPDKARTPTQQWRRSLNTLLFRSELYLLGREAILSLFRRFSSRAQTAYQMRLAGEKSGYGALSQDEKLTLVPRVSLTDFDANLKEFKHWADAHDSKFIWINMPINRREPELVERYVDFNYRKHIEYAQAAHGFSVIDVDRYWLRTRESNLHIPAHLFHPNPNGHRRMAEQIAKFLIDLNQLPNKTLVAPTIAGPFPANTPQTLRLGYSTNSPVHAHIGMILNAHPELAKKHGIELELLPYESGKSQGKALAHHKLDAWFSCAVPAIRMLDSRPDSRILSSMGPMGKIAVVTHKSITTLSQLSGMRVGLNKGSTPEMDWETWSKDLSQVTLVDVPTESLEEALETGVVDAIVSWDPWVSRWFYTHTDWHVLESRPFYSVLIGTHLWSIVEDGSIPRATRLLSLLKEALELAGTQKEQLDQTFADHLGVELTVAQDLSNINPCLSGKKCTVELNAEHKSALLRALQFVHPTEKSIDRLIGEGLLKGQAFRPETKPRQRPIPPHTQ